MSSRSEKMKLYRAKSLAKFQKTKRRVWGVMSKPDYDALAEVAELGGRSVFQQMYLESRAYRQASYLPTKDVERNIMLLNSALRKIGGNCNQLARQGNLTGKFRKPVDISGYLLECERAIAAFTTTPWKISEASKRGGGEHGN